MHKYEEEGAKKRKRQQTESFDRCYHWDELPNGPLIEIAGRLSNFDDLQVMYLVCSRWNSVLRESQCKFLDGGRAGCCGPQVPWLMMAEQESFERKGKGKAMRLFIYSLSFQSVRQLVTRLPPIKENFSNCRLFSSHGWVLVVRTTGSTMTMCLYNPFCSPSSHNYIPLPRLDTLSSSVSRFTLSACPCTKSYTVMIVYASNKIGLWKPGDKVWTLVDHSLLSGVFILDVIFYRGYYYVLDQLKHIFRLSGSDNNELKWERLPSLFDGINDGSGHRYLWKAYFVVGDEEKLLVVVRLCLYPKTQPLFELPHDYLTAGFRVVEILVSPKRFDNRVKDVNSLGTTSLFVGRNQAFAIDVPKANNPSASGYYGCKPNCIYFTDDRLYILTTAKFGKGKDMGVYNMEDGSIDRHFQGLSLQDHSPMLWVEPHL
ncbi:uncharacterized protein LOC141597220 isoform X2 [Silene latifolia]